MAADPSGLFNTNDGAEGEYEREDDIVDHLEEQQHTSTGSSNTLIAAMDTTRNINDNDSMHTSPPPMLPDGRIVDATKAVQSFATTSSGLTYPETTTGTATTTTDTTSIMSIRTRDTVSGMTSSHDTSPSNFSLPDGRIIDGKNTLQSFAVPSISERLSRKNESGTQPNLVQTTPRNSNNNNNTTNVDSSTIAVHAEPVVDRSTAIVVDAEIADSRIYIPQSHGKCGTSSWVLIVAIVIIAVLVTGIGVYCGSGNCGGDNTSMTITAPSPTMVVTTNAPFITSSPTVITNAPLITSSPISALTEQQLTVACNFLNTTNLTACQSKTSFTEAEDTMGNTIPTELGLLTQLQFLDLFNNSLTGTIPSTLANLTELVYLRFDFNQLTGTTPSSFGKLMQLKNYLGFHGNQFNGTIPSTLGNLIQLTDLRLSFNQFTGTIPSELESLTKLSILELYFNDQLTGTVPFGLCSVFGIDILVDCVNVVCSCCEEKVTGDSCS